MTSNENISVSTANNNSPLIDKLIKIKKKFTPETILPDKSRNWIFNAGNYFSGNPKWLFIYINKYRKDINAVWMSESEETAKYVRSLGYEAYQIDSDKAIEIQKKSGVFEHLDCFYGGFRFLCEGYSLCVARLCVAVFFLCFSFEEYISLRQILYFLYVIVIVQMLFLMNVLARNRYFP